MPRKGAYGLHQHADTADGKSARENRALWEGVFAPGEALPLAFALSACGGAMVYLSLRNEPTGLLIGCVFLATVFGIGLFITGRIAGVARLALFLACGFGLGLSAGKVRAELVIAPAIKTATGPVMLEGWVSAIEPAKRGVRLRIRPHAIAGVAAADLPEAVRLTHTLGLKVSPGRFVRCWSVIRPPPGPAIPGDYDFRRQAWFQGLGGVGYVQGRCRGGVLGMPQSGAGKLGLWIAAYRRQLARYTWKVSGTRAGGFAAALVSGDRSYMAAEDQEALRESGLAHLLAISGLHLGIVGGLVYFLFRNGLALIAPLSVRMPVQKLAAIAALLAIAAYLVISGASVSTQRAFIMSAVFFSAILIDRPALSLRSFSIALLLVVLLAPESVFAPGFQMSFAATGVLIAIYEAWSRRRAGTINGVWGRGLFAAKSLVVTSVAASLATAPFAVFHFERLAPLGLIANLSAMPIVSLLSVPSAGLAILLAPFGQAEIGLRGFGASLEVVLAIAEWTNVKSSALDYPLKVMPGAALVAFIGALIAIVLCRRWLRLAGTAGLVLVGSFIWWVKPLPQIYWAPSGEVFLNVTSSGYERIPFAASDALGPLRLRAVEDRALCEEAECHYTLQGGAEVVLVKMVVSAAHCSAAPGAPVILALSPMPGLSPQTCPNLLLWQEVESRGGLEVRIGASGLGRRHARTCSARPWRQCA